LVINETVAYKAVAWLANCLYKEHSTAIPTKHNREINAFNKQNACHWKVGKEWSRLSVEADAKKNEIAINSTDEFIFEHCYGYTKFNKTTSQEYKAEYPRWLINKVPDHQINCDFKKIDGDEFSFLNKAVPDSVLLAEGSPVSVKWKRTRF
jgi:uncharacterized protein